MTENVKWKKSKPLEDIRSLQVLIGELNFIVGMSRPDAAFALNKLERRTRRHWKLTGVLNACWLIRSQLQILVWLTKEMMIMI